MTTNDQFPIDRTDEWEARQDAGRQVEAAPCGHEYPLLNQECPECNGDHRISTKREALAESNNLRLREELAHAQQRVSELEKFPVHFIVEGGPVVRAVDFAVMKERAERAEAELKELRSALQKYGRHTASCRSRINSCLVTCDCGFDAALSLEEKKGKV